MTDWRDNVTITLIVAMSADGKISTRDHAGPRFTSQADTAHLRQRRVESDAVIVGAGTILNDNPAFRLPLPMQDERRAHGRASTPIRCVVSGRGSISPEARLFAGHESPALVFTTYAMPEDRRLELAEVATVYQSESVDVREVVRTLYDDYNARAILLEGGAELSGAFLSADLIDEMWLTVSPVLIGGNGVPTPIGGDGLTFDAIRRMTLLESREEDGDLFLRYRVSR